MSNVNYEKPKMKFVDLRNDESIATDLAGNCMPQVSQSRTDRFYFDAPGDGWVNIIATGKSCNGNVVFEYQDNPDIPGEVTEEEKLKALKAAENAFGTTGYEKQAFSGAFVEPQPSWS